MRKKVVKFVRKNYTFHRAIEHVVIQSIMCVFLFALSRLDRSDGSVCLFFVSVISDCVWHDFRCHFTERELLVRHANSNGIPFHFRGIIFRQRNVCVYRIRGTGTLAYLVEKQTECALFCS